MQVKENEKLMCIKACVMNDGTVATTVGKIYQVKKMYYKDRYYIINDEGESHYFGDSLIDGWSVYFQEIRHLKLERILGNERR